MSLVSSLRHPDSDPPPAAVLPHGQGQEQGRGLPEEFGEECHSGVKQSRGRCAFMF